MPLRIVLSDIYNRHKAWMIMQAQGMLQPDENKPFATTNSVFVEGRHPISGKRTGAVGHHRPA
jgi:hypothetical protein